MFLAVGVFLPGVAGIGFAAAFLCVVALAGSGNVWSIVEGADGRASTSKFQFFVWTAVVLFAYGAIFGVRAVRGDIESVSSIPGNVLLAIGFSAATLAGAKGITTAYVSSQKIGKSDLPQAPVAVDGATKAAARLRRDQSFFGLIQDDQGYPDLSKIQLLVWLAVAVGIYIATTLARVQLLASMSDGDFAKAIAGAGEQAGLPDIDASLMVLMGLAQGAYLGKKLTTTSTPRLTAVSQSMAKAGDTVTLFGSGLTGAANGGQVLLDTTVIPVNKLDSTDSKVAFTIDSNWSPVLGTCISVMLNGQQTNSLPFSVRQPGASLRS